MDVVLGVSMTPTTARLVLVEGAGADGRIVDTDTIVVSEGEGTTSEQVLSAIVGTRDGMLDGGHNLVSTGVVWSDHTEAAELRDSLASRGIDGVEFFSALHAGGALAKAASSVTGYDKSALLVIEPQTATLAVVDSADGSIVGLASEPLITGVTSGVLANLVNPLKGKENAPDGVFLLGLGTDVSDLAESLGDAIALPVNSPDQPELALARGAALASAQEPDFEASTALLGQAYSLEGPTGTGFAHPDAVTESAGEASTELREFEDFDDQPAERKPFLLVGAPLLLVFGICSIALAVSLTVTVRSTVDQGPSSPDRGVVQNPLPAEAPKQAAPPPAPVEAPAPAVSPAPVQQVVAPAPQHNPAPAPKQVAPAPVQAAPQVPAPAPEAPAPAAPAPVPEEQPAPVAPPPAVVPVPIPLFPPVWEPPRRQENPWWPDRDRPRYTPPAQTQQPPIISIPGLPPIGGGDSDRGSHGGSRGGSGRGGWGDDGDSRGGSDSGSRGGWGDNGGSRGGWGDSGSSRGGSDSGSRGGWGDNGGSRGGWGGNSGSHGGGSGGGSNSGFPWPFGGR
ncbi:putative transmembrane protein [Mycobacteroides abscessus subsp. abscessus]|uniref:DUF7159 family protein n=1 Tax=Mycobacteroides abscessus TaxID=36809 RepID=UPI00092C4F75|nr:hypothetical protein [Mycobacteroides abscessus]MDM2398543.1 hypothetical protein [Mycobacteroides abscessus]MDM2409900.1 hypothetical protein [Mycobacteroides abscessus]PVB31755.1 hypothetical protein DDJ45_03040 [Mycobacteroides abscessus]SHR34464.1 putative transmembrane protein [Mycobacteroides abscessus subsp. abscessus]SID05234.1 putative transmembrane protein [Mycobacteroides abscessus subsp. abscessus]